MQGRRADRLPISMSLTRRGLWTVVAVSGDLDVATAPELLEAIEEGGRPELLALDLSRVAFIDSSGLRSLRELEKRTGARIALIGPSPAVADLLRLTKETFDVVEQAEDLDGA